MIRGSALTSLPTACSVCLSATSKRICVQDVCLLKGRDGGVRGLRVVPLGSKSDSSAYRRLLIYVDHNSLELNVLELHLGAP